MEKAKEYALVTGASSGIGREFARQLAREGYGLLLVARRSERLQKLKDELKKEVSADIRILPADLSFRAECGLVAREASKHLELPVLAALERVRNTRQQARLPDAERLTNMDGAFALKTEVAGRRVVLVDDVCTTGATANACAAALLKGGAEAVYLLCFATARGGEEE